MSNKLRVVQVGCGDRAPAHITAMYDSDAIELVALCDRNDDKLQAFGERFGVERRYRDMAEMIREERPELVNIVTRPTIRSSIVAEAIDAGAQALLIEKPIALMPSEGNVLAEWGRDRLIAVNTQYQWMPHWQRFWSLLRDGGLGSVRLLRASTRVNLLDQGPHILDLSLKAAALSGLPEPEWVLAAADGTERYGDASVPGDISATIGLGSARLFLNAGPSAPEVPGETVIWYQQQVEVIGDRGRLWVSLNQGWRLWRDGVFEQGPTGWPKNDGESQAALFAGLRDTMRVGGDAWREFPTRVGVAARNANVMWGCFASVVGGGRVALGSSWPDTVVEEIGRRSIPPVSP
jgi:predicted dehydrogenase